MLLKVLGSVLLAALSYQILNRLYNNIRYTLGRRKHGCPKMPHYKHLEPVLGLDFVWSMVRALREDRFLRFQRDLFASQKCKAFTATFMGARMVYTSESDNMKAMSTSQWHEFGVQPIRLGNGAAMPFTSHGVSTTDGKLWEYSRNLIKPYFDRSGYANLQRLEAHVDGLIRLFPTDGSAIDIQPLVKRWFLDTSTEFLFGQSNHSIDEPEEAEIAWAMMDVQRGLRIRLQLGRLVALHHDRKWLDSIAVVHRVLDRHIDRALAEIKKCKESGVESSRTDLLWIMANQLPDKLALRSQIIAVWVPSNDTTSILISNAFYALARHPRVVQKLRAEILETAPPGTTITWEMLRGMRYLRYIINETHRLYPNGIQMVRVALTDTTLPVGGGPNGDQPIFIQKGDIVHANRYLMHRDPDIWGADADDFRPERWEVERPLWRFVPFGGGPRICPAHVLVDTEASYVLLRVFQRFGEIVPRDERPYTPVMRIGPSSKYGVSVSLIPVV
ncbi:cytochrome P450 monooxygenase [Cercophora scortea]|uniref:Cytochrome P450 monooxygenase n=1 Tax=Cercophora scortea TaxID=314031 RepID=A0AAE0IXP7_9PEZI|nr:cytochrome P450 monooxygenase [Cercophora scortea]